MRRIALAAAAACALGAVPAAAAPGAPASGPGVRIPLDHRRYEETSARRGWETTFVCAALSPSYGRGGVVDAVAYLFNVNPGPTGRIIMVGYRFIRTNLCFTVEQGPLSSLPPSAFRSGTVSSLRILPAPRPSEPFIEVRFPDGCPYARRRAGACTPRNPTVLRVNGAHESASACRALKSANSPLADLFEEEGFGNWGDDWKVLKSRGKLKYVRSAELTPARLERICGLDTPRSRRLARELGRPLPAPFSLGPSAVAADGTFTNGRGGCPVSTSFEDAFGFLAAGDGTLTITQPSTGDRVSGAIRSDGTFRLRSAGESYDGKITGNTATARYSYTANGCTETYDVNFVLRR